MTNKKTLLQLDAVAPFGGGQGGGGHGPPLISGGAQFQPRDSLFIRPCSTFFLFFLPYFYCELLLNSKFKILDDYCISRKYPVFAVLPN